MAGSWTIAASGVSSLCLALLLFVTVQGPAFADILNLAQSAKPGPDAWLLPASLISTSLVLLAPGMVLASGLLLAGHPKASRTSFIVLSSLVMVLALVDLDLLRSIGRHLREIAALALQPQGHVAGGNIWSWVGVVVQWSAAATIGSTLVTLACQRIVAALARLLTPLLRRVIAAAAGVALAMLIAGPPLLLTAWGNHPLVERLYASSLIDVRPDQGLLEGPSTLDPRLAELYARLRSSYRAAYSAVAAGKPGDTRAVALPARPPNVVLIVTESFRHDAFGPELMPRLTRWAEQGLVSTRHDAGTIYSQSAAFALLYGRSPAAFHQTLDARVPPQFCTTLRSSGYECAYFTGHPKQWLRREEFLNELTMDHFIHDDRGSWPEWDRRALDGMVELANTSQKPIFAIVLLMSSHFEYRYPPEYEIDKPVSDSTWKVTMVNTLGPDAEVPHRNRYRNCMRFIDDVVSDAIARLDPQRNLVIFTGDHGESINDDGHYTHGYSFAEIVTRTPFAMVGPGVPPTRLETPTLHVDVLPSALHALSGQHQSIANVHGIDWFAGERHTSLLESDSPHSKHGIEAQLRAAGRHLRLDLDLTRPYVTLLGFEDAMGRLQPTPDLTEPEVKALADAFEEQLAVLRR
jgi:phosphoglycerol transferase MdoB-like AlkP superfamily enzyme